MVPEITFILLPFLEKQRDNETRNADVCTFCLGELTQCFASRMQGADMTVTSPYTAYRIGVELSHCRSAPENSGLRLVVFWLPAVCASWRHAKVLNGSGKLHMVALEIADQHVQPQPYDTAGDGLQPEPVLPAVHDVVILEALRPAGRPRKQPARC